MRGLEWFAPSMFALLTQASYLLQIWLLYRRRHVAVNKVLRSCHISHGGQGFRMIVKGYLNNFFAKRNSFSLLIPLTLFTHYDFNVLQIHRFSLSQADPMIPPPPPPPPMAFPSDIEKGNDDALANMLMSWYMVGYHTGYYQVCCYCHHLHPFHGWSKKIVEHFLKCDYLTVLINIFSFISYIYI